MRFVLAGVIMGLGGAWLLFWLFALLFARQEIYANNAFLNDRLVAQKGSATLDAEGKAAAQRLVTVTRRGLPIALVAVLVGIVAAVV